MINEEYTKLIDTLPKDKNSNSTALIWYQALYNILNQHQFSDFNHQQLDMLYHDVLGISAKLVGTKEIKFSRIINAIEFKMRACYLQNMNN